MKINLPIIKDEDAKDSNLPKLEVGFNGVLMCRLQDCTLLPYAIRSLQVYPRELVQSSSTDITLDNVLTILDKPYNNVKVLHALNQELLHLQIVDKKKCQTGALAFQGIFKFKPLPSLTVFPQIVWQC